MYDKLLYITPNPLKGAFKGIKLNNFTAIKSPSGDLGVKLLIFILIFLATVSCSHNEIFFEYHSFSNAEWNQNDSVVFNVPIEKNSQLCDVSIEIRNSDAYPFSNIWLYIDFTTSGGNIVNDTIGKDMADEYGRWLGKGLSLYNRSITYKPPFILFPDSGMYVFSIRHAMQVNPLKGISDIGLKVSKKSGK